MSVSLPAVTILPPLLDLKTDVIPISWKLALQNLVASTARQEGSRRMATDGYAMRLSELGIKDQEAN